VVAVDLGWRFATLAISGSASEIPVSMRVAAEAVADETLETFSTMRPTDRFPNPLLTLERLASFRVEGVKLIIRQIDVGSPYIFFQVFDLGRSRNGQHYGTALEYPG
jgi:hypothetical protein